MDSEELKRRTKDFAIRIVRLANALPRGRVGDSIGHQLLRCGTSVGANYRAACHARSKADFISKMGIVEEEADECGYWIELLVDLRLVTASRIAGLLEGASELVSIAAASGRTARRNV